MLDKNRFIVNIHSTSDVSYKLFSLVKLILTFASHASQQMCMVQLAKQRVLTETKYGCQCLCQYKMGDAGLQCTQVNICYSTVQYELQLRKQCSILNGNGLY